TPEACARVRGGHGRTMRCAPKSPSMALFGARSSAASGGGTAVASIAKHHAHATTWGAMDTSTERSGTILRADPLPRVETAVTMRSASHFFVDRYGDITGGGIFVATTRELDIDQQVLV